MSPSVESRENREFAEEIKFLVTPAIGQQVRAWARAYLAPDPNAHGSEHDEYRITSLYFDTPEFDVFRRNGSYGRSKFRIRRYGSSEQVFLERKLKTRGLVSKRRTLVPLEEIDRLAANFTPVKWRGSWYQDRLGLRRLKPVCQITYDRTARVTMTASGPIRLTIDQNLRAVPLSGVEFSGRDGTPIAPESMIVEMKFRATLPPLFRSVIQEFALTPTTLSKYRLSVVKLGLMPLELLDSAASPAKTAAYA